MKTLIDRIKKEGKCYPGGILKVDKFINHQMDPNLMKQVAVEFIRRYASTEINKIITIEASGIALAAATALEMNVPMVFAKKNATANVSGEVYCAKVASFTHKKIYDVIVPKDYLSADDCVLIVDDFLAQGNALNGLVAIVEESGASVAGCGIIIEKGFQGGGDALREKGYRVESLAIVESMNDETGEITFRGE